MRSEDEESFLWQRAEPNAIFQSPGDKSLQKCILSSDFNYESLEIPNRTQVQIKGLKIPSTIDSLVRTQDFLMASASMKTHPRRWTLHFNINPDSSMIGYQVSRCKNRFIKGESEEKKRESSAKIIDRNNVAETGELLVSLVAQF